MSLQYLKEAALTGDNEKLIRYVRLHFGDGNEAAGAKEIDKAWIEALKLLLDVPATEREFIEKTVSETDAETLTHLYFRLDNGEGERRNKNAADDLGASQTRR